MNPIEIENLKLTDLKMAFKKYLDIRYGIGKPRIIPNDEQHKQWEIFWNLLKDKCDLTDK